MLMLTKHIGATLPINTKVGWVSGRGKLLFGIITVNNGYNVKIQATIDGQKSTHRLFKWEKYFLAEDDNVVMLAILEHR